MSDANRKWRLVKAASRGAESAGNLPEALDLEFVYPTCRVIVADEGPDTYVRSIHGKIEFSTAYEDKETGEYGEWRAEAGRFHALYVDAFLARREGVRLFDVMNAESSEMKEICEALFNPDTGGIRKEAEELLGSPFCGNLLVVHRLEILPAHRGVGLGLAALWYIVRLHSAGCGIVAIKAIPMQFRAGFDAKPDDWNRQLAYDSFRAGRDIAQRKLVSHWGKLGFREIDDSGVMAISAASPGPVPEEIRHWVPGRLSRAPASR
jgi:hypothetical protein